jgi:hypothetical protein
LDTHIYLGYRNAPIYKNINLLAIMPLRIQPATPSSSSRVVERESDLKMEQRVGLALAQMLQKEYGNFANETCDRERIRTGMKLRNPLLANLLPLEALAKLKPQLQAFAKGAAPFNRPFSERTITRHWWTEVQRNDMADVLGVSPCSTYADLLCLIDRKALAIKINSVMVNSMVDERTMSTISWLNAAKRNRQEVNSIKEQIIIRQWHRWNPDVVHHHSIPSANIYFVD